VLNDIGTREPDHRLGHVPHPGRPHYTVGKWDLDSAVGYSKNEIDQVGTSACRSRA
jgi:hypothetical protein